MSIEMRQKISKTMLGKKKTKEHSKNISLGQKGKIIPEKLKEKMSISALRRYKTENHPFKKILPRYGKEAGNWRGGLTSKNKLLRNSKQFQEWREEVFKRDNYTCQRCNIRNGLGKTIHLHPHHIKSFNKYPKLRFLISNGITLCKECHKKTKSYGKQNKKRRNK